MHLIGTWLYFKFHFTFAFKSFTFQFFPGQEPFVSETQCRWSFSFSSPGVINSLGTKLPLPKYPHLSTRRVELYRNAVIPVRALVFRLFQWHYTQHVWSCNKRVGRIMYIILLVWSPCPLWLFSDSLNRGYPMLKWLLVYDKSTLVQVMAWCRQATSHYLSQCWPISAHFA